MLSPALAGKSRIKKKAKQNVKNSKLCSPIIKKKVLAIKYRAAYLSKVIGEEIYFEYEYRIN